MRVENPFNFIWEFSLGRALAENYAPKRQHQTLSVKTKFEPFWKLFTSFHTFIPRRLFFDQTHLKARWKCVNKKWLFICWEGFDVKPLDHVSRSVKTLFFYELTHLYITLGMGQQINKLKSWLQLKMFSWFLIYIPLCMNEEKRQCELQWIFPGILRQLNFGKKNFNNFLRTEMKFYFII